MHNDIVITVTFILCSLLFFFGFVLQCSTNYNFFLYLFLFLFAYLNQPISSPSALNPSIQRILLNLSALISLVRHCIRPDIVNLLCKTEKCFGFLKNSDRSSPCSKRASFGCIQSTLSQKTSRCF